MNRTMRKFRQGKADYAAGKPRPEWGESDGRPTSSGVRHLGWMIARAKEIGKIIDELKRCGADQDKRYDVILNRRVRMIDRERWLPPLAFDVV